VPVSKQAVTVRRVDTYTDTRPGGEQIRWSSQPPPFSTLWGRGTTGFTNPTEEERQEDLKAIGPGHQRIAATPHTRKGHRRNMHHMGHNTNNETNTRVINGKSPLNNHPTTETLIPLGTSAF
jgi:hypothetical protein